MKKLFLTALLPWLCLTFLQAQDQPLPPVVSPPTQDTLKNKLYAVWMNESIFKKRYLWGLTDSTITLGTNPKRPRTGLVTYPIEEVKWLNVRREKNVLCGAGIGFATGAAIGFIIGYAEGDDRCNPGSWCILELTARQKGSFVAMLGAPIGAMVGGVLGSIRTKIPINGSRNTLAQQRKELEQYRRRL